MTYVSCSVSERFVNPLFEVFDGGDFILSSYHDIEEDFTRMRIYFEDAARAEEAKRCLQAALDVVGCPEPIETGDIPDEDWKLAYRRHFKTEPVGRRLLIVPEWEAEDARRKTPDASREMVVLDPGMAFGTGKHETTRACLEYIDELSSLLAHPSSLLAHPSSLLAPPSSLLAPPSSLSFLDRGCGSGILSIAAAKLGFSPVAGFDIDEEAVKASRENAGKNGVAVDYRVFALGKGAVTLDASIEAAKGIYPDLALQGRANGPASAAFAPADLVVANILGPLLIAFADEIVGYVKGHLIISGILTELYPEVLAAFAAHGLKEISRKTQGEWTTGLLMVINFGIQ